MKNIITQLLDGVRKDTEVNLWRLYLEFWKGLTMATLAPLYLVAVVVLVVARRTVWVIGLAFENVIQWQVEQPRVEEEVE